MAERPILVTGADGFVGRHLLKELRKRPGTRVVGTSRRGAAGLVKLDLADEARTRAFVAKLKPRLVYNAAGRTAGTERQLWRDNVQAAVALLNALGRAGRPARAVLLGSAAEYGPIARPRAGVTPLRPLTPYGWSKACQSVLAGLDWGRGVQVIVARLFNLTGPGLPVTFAAGAFAAQIAQAEKRGQGVLRVGALDTRRDFLDVSDAARAVLLLGEKGEAGRAYDVGSGAPLKVEQVLRELVSLSPARLKVRREAARKAPGVPLSVADPRELRRLGWRPTISWRTSLRRTLERSRARF